jgi:hypothetical protein
MDASEGARKHTKKRQRSASLDGTAASSELTSGSTQTSPFEEVTLALCVTLLPSRMADIYEGIRANAYELLMRYHEEAGGVILALSDIRFPDGQHHGRILNEMPHLHFNIEAKAQVFRPQPGSPLSGRISQVRLEILVCFTVFMQCCNEALPRMYNHAQCSESSLCS